MLHANHGGRWPCQQQSMSTYMSIYLSFICFYGFNYNYSLMRVSLFVLLLNSPLSSLTMSTHSLSTSLSPWCPSLQVQPDHHSSNYNRNANRQWQSQLEKLYTTSANTDWQTWCELQQELHDHRGSASNTMPDAISSSSNNNTMSDARNINMIMPDNIPIQLDPSTTRTWGQWRERKYLQTIEREEGYAGVDNGLDRERVDICC